MSYLCITIRWLDSRYHGQDADGDPEWPPSPLRLFQALLAGNARQGGEIDTMCDGLRWLENLPHPPVIIAPKAHCGQSFTRFVPNNDSDKQFDRQHRLTAKKVSPMLFFDPPSIFYLWPLPFALTFEDHDKISMLLALTQKITTLGWGIDMAVGQGAIRTEEEVAALPGERWLPGIKGNSHGLRVPVGGSLADLMTRHEGFIHRLDQGIFTPPPPLSVYAKVEYRREIDPPTRQFVAFSLLKPDGSGYRAFDTVRQALTVAGMTRHAACTAATGWSEEEVATFILGHGEPLENPKHATVGPSRFAYLPLPSIEFRGAGKVRVVGGVRRVMLFSYDTECEEKIDWARRTLSGHGLVEKTPMETSGAKKDPVALLSLQPTSDRVVQAYVRPSATWASVTPVILPGYDDPAHYRRRMKKGVSADEQKRLLLNLDTRIDGLFRKAISQAGFPKVLADNAAIEWRKVGYWRGADLADRYRVPDHLKCFPRYHAKIHWRDEQQLPIHIDGPICIGGGRFYGLGLFAATG